MGVLKQINKNFFKQWTSEMAYVLGFFAADGCITVNKRGGQFCCIQIADKKLLYAIRRVLKSTHKIGKRAKRENKKALYRIQIGSVEMCNDLRRIGFSERKTINMVVPDVPEGYLADFARGYFDGDGNVWMGLIHKNRPTATLTLLTMFTSCSTAFLEQFRVRLHQLGVKGGSIYHTKDTYSRLQFSTLDSLKLYEIMYNGNCSSLLLERKRRIFEKYKKQRFHAPVV